MANNDVDETEVEKVLNRLSAESKQQVTQSDYLARSIESKAAADTLRLSFKSGLPLDTVFRDIPDAKARVNRLPFGEADRMERESPVIWERIKNPYRFAAYRDDLAQLERIEALTKKLREPVYRPSTDEELRRIVEPVQRARAAKDYPMQPERPQLVGDLGDTLPWYKSEQEMGEAYVQEGIKALRTKEAFLQGDTSRTSVGQRVAQALMVGGEAGVKTQELGRAGYRMQSGERGAAIDAEIKELEAALSKTPQGSDFASRFLYPGAKIVGQMANSASQSVGRGAQGAMLGLGASAMLGPAAPVAAGPAAIKGFGIGMTVGMAEDSYFVEAGHAYLDMNRIRGKNGEQLDEDTKQAAAATVGALNAAIEMVSLKVLSGPFKAAAKKFISEGVNEAIVQPTMRKAVLRFARDWGLSATTEAGTEGLQEFINIVGEDLAKMATDGEFETLANSPKLRAEAFERILTVSSEAFRGALVVGLPGATVNLAAEARKVKQTQELLKELGGVFDQLKIAETNPQEPEAIVKSAAAEIGVPFLHVPAKPLVEYYGQQGIDPAKRIEDLTGIGGDELIKIVEGQGDIQLPTEKFISMSPEEKTFLQPLYRKDPNDMNGEELEREIKTQDDIEKQRVAEVERVKKKEADQAAKSKIDASVARIREILENAADAAGLKNEVTADALKLVEKAFRRIGERSGVDPLELFSKYNLTVKKDQAPTATGEGEQVHAQPDDPNGPHRGELRIGDNRRMTIHFFEGLADKSTFPHEFLGHFYAELLGDVAERADAPADIKEDYQKILDYLGIKHRSEMTEEMHEKWSRTVEKYLEKGVAPSKDLRGVFNRFARLMASIYKEAVNYFKGINITPELRDVLDRIFAAQQAIEEARTAQAATALIPEIEAAVKSGLLTPAEGDRLAKAEKEDREEAEAQVTEEIFKDLTRKNDAEWKKGREEFREGVTKEANEKREYVAESVLKTGVMPDGTEAPESLQGAKLWRDAIKQMGFVEGTLEKIEDMTAARGEGAMHPDDAAEAFNFENGYDLVNTLAHLEMKEVYIERRIDELMEAKHGPPLTPEQIREKAVEAMHGEHRRKVLRVQMEILASKNRAALGTGIRAVGRRVPSTEQLRDSAEKLITAMPAHRVNPHLYQAAEKRAAMEAHRELAKGNIRGALDAKIREAINHERYLAAVGAREDFKKIAKHLGTLLRREAQERIGKGNPDHVDQINKLLEKYDLKPSRITNENRKTVETWIEEQRANGYEPAIADMFLREGEKKSLKDATIGELRDLYDAVKSIEAIAKRDREVRVLNKYLEKEVAVAEMLERAGKLTDVKKKPEKILRTIIDRLKDKAISFDSEAVPIESLMEELDGGAVGPWHDYLWNRASESQSMEYDLTREVTEKIVKLTEKYMDASGQSVKDLIQTRLQADPMSRYRLMSIIFNMGTESSLDKMLRGEEQRGNNWTESMLREAASNLSEKDLKYIQDVWNVLDTLWPKVEEIEKRVSGVAAPKLDRRPFTVTTRDGKTVEMQGGYYPLKYDPELSEVGKKQETGVLAGLVEEGYTPASTPGSHRKARTQFAAPLLYDFGAITQKHLAGVIKDVSHREFLIDAQKLLRDPRIRKILQEKLGTEYEGMFKPWLKSIASDGVVPTQLTGFGKLMEKGRSTVTTVALGYKFGTMLAQVAGLPNAFEYIQQHYGSRYFFSAWAQFTSHPADTYNFITEKSGEMRNRWKSLDADARYNLRDIIDVEKGPAGTIVKLKKNIAKGAYVGINIMDRFISVPTWMAAYNAVMEKAKTDTSITEEHAIHAGDAAVRRSQGAGGAKDLSAVQRARGAERIFTMFMTPFFAAYGRYHNIARGLKEAKGFKGKMAYAPGLAMRVALVTMIPAIIAEFLTKQGPDDETPEQKAKRYAKRAAWSLAAPLPYIRTLADLAERAIEKDGVRDVRVSPVIDAFESTAKTGWNLGEAVFGDRELDDNLVFDAFERSGYVTGLPTAQPRITLEYIYDLLSGDASPEGPGTLMHDLLFRRPSSRNPR